MYVGTFMCVYIALCSRYYVFLFNCFQLWENENKLGILLCIHYIYDNKELEQRAWIKINVHVSLNQLTNTSSGIHLL